MNKKKIIHQILDNFQLIRNKAFSSSMKSGKQGIALSQWVVLNIIEKNAKVNIKEIAAILGVTSSATTQLVNNLVKHGYVKRSTDKKDKRALNLVISKRGKNQMEKIKKTYIKTGESLFGVLSEAELSQYLELQNKIIRSQ